MSAYGGQAEHHRKDYGGDGEQIIRFHAAIDNVEDEDRWPDTVGQQGCWPSGSVKRRQPSIEALVGETKRRRVVFDDVLYVLGKAGF